MSYDALGVSDAMLDSLSLQLREAEARKFDAERAHQVSACGCCVSCRSIIEIYPGQQRLPGWICLYVFIALVSESSSRHPQRNFVGWQRDISSDTLN